MYCCNIHWNFSILTQLLKLIYRTVTKIIHISVLWEKKKELFFACDHWSLSEMNNILQSQKMEKNQRDIKICVNKLKSKNYCIYHASLVRTTFALVFCKYYHWYQSPFCHWCQLCLAISGWYSEVIFFYKQQILQL